MNSALNPEAPEFYPHLTSVTQDGYSTINKTIRTSNQMPSEATYDIFKNFTDFNIVTSHISKNVILQSNQIIKTELPAVKLRHDDNEHNTDKIIDADDSILDRVNINIDLVSGVRKSDETILDGLRPAVNVSSWNKQTPIIAKFEVGSATFIGAKNIPRPQLSFKDTIDNSNSLWVPKISDKPNNIKPLTLNILYNNEGEAVGYEHPYQLELDLYHPGSEFIDPDPTPPVYPPPLENTQYTYIDTEAQFDKLIKHLEDVKEMAVDVEHHSYRTYQGITCLIQISTDEGGDFIIDALAVREHIHKLNLAFTDPRKIKVLHGAKFDVLWLQRDFGVYFVGLFDTHQAAKTLKLNGLSLKYLLLKYCGVNADKRYQLADWRIRPLPEELSEYARMDTHFLLYIWRKMKSDLLAASAEQPQLLLSVFDTSRQICLTMYNKEVLDDESHMNLYIKSKKSFNTQQMLALKMLYKWRDAQARALDESTMYLLPNHMMLSLAETLPREVQGVNSCCSPMPPFVKQNLMTIHRMLLSCRELPTEPQLYQMPSSIRTMINVNQSLNLYSTNMFDLSQFPEITDEDNGKHEFASMFADDLILLPKRIHAFEYTFNGASYGVVSDLNVDAKHFVPPYDRYRKYRALAQLEEIKDFKEKEAKIAAIGKSDDLIKTEVLLKVQQAKAQVENEEQILAEPKNIVTKESEKRKRKMSSDKINRQDSALPVTNKVDSNPKNNSETNKNLKPFAYKNVDYRKFYDDTKKIQNHKQLKTKYKKCRK